MIAHEAACETARTSRAFGSPRTFAGLTMVPRRVATAVKTIRVSVGVPRVTDGSAGARVGASFPFHRGVIDSPR